MRVSIVIPCYNQAKYLVDAIESVKLQTYEDIEIIIVNDGSTANLTHIESQYKFDAYYIKFINQNNKGLSAARNTGIRNASGTFILPLDADDRIAPDFIENTICHKDIVAGWCQEFEQSNKLWEPIPNPTYEDFVKRNQINHCALFKKEMWEELGGYDENMRDGFEDWDFWLRATKAGYKVTVTPEALFFYRKHGPSMVNHALKNKTKIMEYMKAKGSLP